VILIAKYYEVNIQIFHLLEILHLKTKSLEEMAINEEFYSAVNVSKSRFIEAKKCFAI